MDTIAKSLLLVLICSVSAQADADQVYLRKLEQRYQLKDRLLEAVYFVESSSGTILGTVQAERVLSERDKMFLQKIAHHTNRSVSDFYGSTAGCIGPFQFKPETWWRFKQDGDGDGIRDPLNFYDAAATAALYLSREIALRGFDTALARYGGALTAPQIYVGRVQQYLSGDR